MIGSAYFSRAMVSLLSAAGAGGETSVHAMNVLRALFRDARLGDSVGVHVTAGIRAAVTGFKAPTSAVRAGQGELCGSGRQAGSEQLWMGICSLSGHLLLL